MISVARYLTPGALFYEEVARAPQPYSTTVPHGWTRHADEEWTSYLPPAGTVAPQGWKVHVSAVPDDAIAALERTARVAVAHETAFKHLSTREAFLRRNSKLYPREHAGKFVALYPDEDRLSAVLADLEEALAGLRGPYILSDRRWSTAPIYLRYGAFAARMTPEGPVTTLRAPDGTEVDDSRSVAFTVPTWAPVPPVLRDWLRVLDQQDDEPLPFTVEQAISFSNAGGVYRARLGEKPMILKEARPGSGLDPTLRDAVARLETEHAALTALGDLEGLPRICYEARHWEHHFLGQTVVPGIPLHQWASASGGYYARDAQQSRDHVSACLAVLRRVRALVDRVHACGWAHMDLHPGNVLVDPETLSVGLIDFENALPLDAPARRQVMAAAGFGLDGEHTPAEHDAHGLRQIASYLLWPGVVPSGLVPDHARTVVAAARSASPYPGLASSDEVLVDLLALVEELASAAPANTSRVVTAVLPEPAAGPATSTTWARDLSIGIAEAVNAQRPRRHPTHHRALRHGWHGIGFGDAVVDLLADGRHAAELPSGHLTTGLWTGLAGELLTLGDDRSEEVVQTRLEDLLATSGATVFNGRPGVLLALRHVPAATEAPVCRRRVERAVTALALDYLDGHLAPATMTTTTRGSSPLHQTTGLLHGHLGIAWALAAYAPDGPEVVRAALASALTRELEGYSTDRHGTLQQDQGARRLPYLATGSAGFGVVLGSLPADLVPAEVIDALPALVRATEATTSVFPGLLNGYAGLALGRAGLLAHSGAEDPWQGPAADLVQRLPFYAVRLGRGAMLCGDEGPRVSSDVATGAAGVLLALRCLETHETDPVTMIGRLGRASASDTTLDGTAEPTPAHPHSDFVGRPR